jgi:class 3 adenylate cyclase/YHS domain-containing protein
MEKNVAILVADLSGYSALTETHGALSAANLIDRYIAMAENSLVGDCRLHQQTGDELMFVSDAPDQMLATARRLAVATASEEHFLQVHGGLHYGKLLKRGGNYFGTAINVAARIASKAIAGTFYCSAEFVASVTDNSAPVFQSKGNYLLKNISAEKEIFELSVNKIKINHIDPVCRMVILDPKNAFRHPGKDQLYFCSFQCLEVYKENQKFAQVIQSVN